MNLSKLKTFGELQDQVMELTEGKIPLVAFYQEAQGIAVHNPFLDVTGRFPVDPIKEYGEEKLAFMEAKIKEIEADMGCPIEEIKASDLRLYLGGKFYLGKEPSLECFEKIPFDSKPMFIKNNEESLTADTLSFYTTLFDGFEELIPERAFNKVVPMHNDKTLDLYFDYDIASKNVSFIWISESEKGCISVSKEAKEVLLNKMDETVKRFYNDSLERMIEIAIGEYAPEIIKDNNQSQLNKTSLDEKLRNASGRVLKGSGKSFEKQNDMEH